MRPTHTFRIFVTGIGCLAIAVIASSCTNASTATHSASELLPALLEVSDVSFIPTEWEENMRQVVTEPSAPWENTLDPYLCTEAGTPAALTKTQAQLELTGGSVMETLLSSDNATDLFQELDDAYKKCVPGTSTSYEALTDAPAVGDESSSYRTERGVVTIARFDNDLMILKWWVGAYYTQSKQYYPDLVTAAADKVSALSE